MQQTEEDTERLGKRKRRTNTRYAGFWRHTNDKGDDIGVPGIDLPAPQIGPRCADRGGAHMIEEE
ncbi:hypothetical protein DFH08DRAFT_967900 [Mycena albidolilacea]|uniref:Uncharacterized protein n=1 Tax=Mycena albidolilacea TaxID=1033008 RepID=A0AAD6ZKG9_9AGAR|nr:hypothetical protein DFH08DRAFT_967900 [Mycena albidolilacea]